MTLGYRPSADCRTLWTREQLTCDVVSRLCIGLSPPHLLVGVVLGAIGLTGPLSLFVAVVVFGWVV